MMRTLSVAIAAAATVAVMSMPAAEAAGNTLQGTVVWTTTLTTARDSAGSDKLDATETRHVTLKVRMTRDKVRHGWQAQDNGSSYSGSYNLSSTRLERSVDGAVECTVTHAASIPASGSLKKKPTSTTAPALFASISPATSTLGTGTKRIVLTPILRYAGQETVTYAGSGTSPCADATETNDIDGSLAPSSSSQQICLPPGTSTKNYSPTANDVVGSWSNAKKSFIFNCTKTWDNGNGETVKVTISGSLKLK